MNIPPQYLQAIQRLGYTASESSFLYIVATHSGYFTRQQFLRFHNKAKGWSVHRLTSKTIARGHARATEYAWKTHIYNLYSRSIYGEIDKDNLRNRRRQSNELINIRLLILDFVLAHPDFQYFETEREKIAYFCGTMRVPLPVLPGRVYKGAISNSDTKRFFVDRCPIFFPNGSNTLSLGPAITFTYCDSGHPSLAPFVTHIRAYEKFLRWLPAFNFIYASPSAAKFSRAANFFSKLFTDPEPIDTQHLTRYFHIRRLWDANLHATLTRADRDLLRDGDERYQGERFESVYLKWVNQGLSEVDLAGFVDQPQPHQQRSFHTYVLPEAYDIFYHEAATRYRPPSRTRWSDSRSA